MTDKSKVKVDVDLPEEVEKVDPNRPHTNDDPGSSPPPTPPTKPGGGGHP